MSDLATHGTSLMKRCAHRLDVNITTGHDWPNTDDELCRLQAARLLREAADRIEALEAEVERLRVQVKQADERGDDALRRAHAAEAQVARLALDAARLDWFDKNPSRVRFSHGYHGSKSNWAWQCEQGHGHDAPNLRAAITAAMAARPEGKT